MVKFLTMLSESTYLITIFILIIIIFILLFVIFRLRKQTRRNMLGLDEITEDTLKNLYHLAHEQPKVRDSDLVRAAEVDPDRLPLILAELVRRNWATVDDHIITILPVGQKRAIELIRAHRLWERYLAEKEGLALEALHDEATRREHLSSPEEINRIEAELGYPQYDPHGDPIPSALGEMPQMVDGSQREGAISLAKWPERRVGRIVHVEDEPPALFNQLRLLGLSPGAYVEVDERTPGRVLVWSGRIRLAIAPAAAELVYVIAAPPESIPLSEVEIGYAARISAFDQSSILVEQWKSQGLLPGVEISVVRSDPLGESIIYRINGIENKLTRLQSNQIQVDVDSLHEIPIPRKHWLVEGWERVREIFRRYGSNAVIKRALVFFGPAFVVSVGYMDPGNWGTDIEGGARFGYQLLWVILMANLMAILMQILSAKLGIATGKSLPEVSRDHYPRWLTIFLWVTAELAAIATDLAEFIGGAVGFYLLFNIPLFPAALLTGVIISIILMAERYGFRKVELIIISLIAVIGFVYMAEIWLSNPDWRAIIHGLLVPRVPIGSLLVIVGIIGATVMPHNLYLHSALIQTRVRPSDSLNRKKEVYRLAVVDSVIALNGAFFVNAAILIMAAAVFTGGKLKEYSLENAYQTLTPLLGPAAGIAFAIALLASGLASSTTATMAGQVIMEGFLHHKMNVWLRRGITMIPSLIVIGFGVDPLRILILSQVSLSFQLPFAMIPLVLFTNNSKIMGEFANNRRTKVLAWLTTIIILSLNFFLIIQVLRG
jgi:manganese transport protein